jgi:AcrR family transcriptional regulator
VLRRGGWGSTETSRKIYQAKWYFELVQKWLDIPSDPGIQFEHVQGLEIMPKTSTRTKSSGSESTREHILQTAIRLFRDRGYEETTMRAIAEKADVSLGNAYYYFQSKEHLVQGLYRKTLDDQIAGCQPILKGEQRLRYRIMGVALAQLSALEPYQVTLQKIFRFGADPNSPLSPFSDESKEVRDKIQQMFKELVEGSREQIPDDLKVELPLLLWLFHMGTVFFWIHDRSFGKIRTRKLIERSAELIATFIGLASLPLMKPLRQNLLKLLSELKEDGPLAFTDVTSAGARSEKPKKHWCCSTNDDQLKEVIFKCSRTFILSSFR